MHSFPQLCFLAGQWHGTYRTRCLVLLEKLEKSNNHEAVDMLANLSPVAWAHIQLAGNDIFGDEKVSFDLNNMLEDVDLFSSITDE
jgi:hypothetical protein